MKTYAWTMVVLGIACLGAGFAMAPVAPRAVRAGEILFALFMLMWVAPKMVSVIRRRAEKPAHVSDHELTDLEVEGILRRQWQERERERISKRGLRRRLIL